MADMKQNVRVPVRKKKEKVKEEQTEVKSSLKVKGVKAIKERQTRMEILQQISDATGLKRVEVEAVFTEMAKIVKAHLKKQGSGEIMIPKLGLKIRKVRRKPTKERKMVSPLTGQEVIIPPKRARDDVKLIALKTLKESLLA